MAKLKSTTVTGNLAVSGNITGTLPAHGNHVPTTQTASNKIFLRNDNTWQTITPANIGAEAANSNIQAHISSAHAPSNAQKNSDITKAEIEAKLTGTITTHAHNYASTAVATTSVNGLMAAADKTKLNGIATGANAYTHPNDANTRHVTDNEKSIWNGTKAELDALKDQVSQNKPIVITDDTPVGTIVFIDSSVSIQDGWLKCDGSSVSTTTYADLFKVVGYTHGGSGTSFKLPDLRVGNLVIDGINDAETVIDSKVAKRQIGIIKAKKLNQDMITVAQDWNNFKTNGGKIGGTIDTSKVKASAIEVADCVISALDTDPLADHISTTKDKLVFRSKSNEESTVTVVLDNALQAFRPRIPTSGSIDLGADTARWKDLYLSGFSIASNGYSKLPNGVVMQWGAIQIENPVLNSYHDINFPMQFKDKPFRFLHSNEGWDANSNPRNVGSFAKSELCYNTHQRVRIGEFNSATKYVRIVWLALGKIS